MDKEGRVIEKAKVYNTHHLLCHILLVKQVKVQSRLGNRFHLLRGEAVKSYYKGHGHKKRSKAAATFAID